MPDRYPFKEAFVPVVNVGENVYLQKVKPIYGKITFIGTLPYTTKDFGVLNAANSYTESDIEVTELHVDDGMFAQCRFQPITNSVYVTELKQPKAKPQWTGKTTAFRSVDNLCQLEPLIAHLNLQEVFQYKDTKMYMSVASGTTTTTESVIAFGGFLFTFDVLTTQPDIFTPIPVEGNPYLGQTKELI